MAVEIRFHGPRNDKICQFVVAGSHDHKIRR